MYLYYKYYDIGTSRKLLASVFHFQPDGVKGTGIVENYLHTYLQ